jgi:hypothetical protein
MVPFEPLFRDRLGMGERSNVGGSGTSSHGSEDVRVVRCAGGEIVNDGGGATGGVAAGGAT